MFLASVLIMLVPHSSFTQFVQLLSVFVSSLVLGFVLIYGTYVFTSLREGDRR